MKEHLSEQQEAVINEAVAKINENLPFPKSLHLDRTTGSATYFLASGMIDESGGGSVHDIDYYEFPADALNTLILTSSESGNTAVEAEVSGTRFTDYVDWPYGREDGSEVHRDNEPVTLLLGFKKRKEMDVFVIAESKSDIPPQISIDGFIALLKLDDLRRKSTYSYKNMVYSFLNDPILPDFGNLSDLETPCELVFDNYYTPETSTDGDYSEECRRILYFDKAMVIEALTKLKREQKVEVTGPGRAIHFLEKSGYGYNHNENTVEINLDNPVEVTMTAELKDLNHPSVVFNFDSRPTDSSNGLSLNRYVSIEG